MQALEINAEVTDLHEIHLKLPETVSKGKVKVIIMYDDTKNIKTTPPKRLFGQFRGQVLISNGFDDELGDQFWMGDNQ